MVSNSNEGKTFFKGSDFRQGASEGNAEYKKAKILPSLVILGFWISRLENPPLCSAAQYLTPRYTWKNLESPKSAWKEGEMKGIANTYFFPSVFSVFPTLWSASVGMGKWGEGEGYDPITSIHFQMKRL